MSGLPQRLGRRWSSALTYAVLLAASVLEFFGTGGHWFVGPEDERWDLLMLIRQASIDDFFAFASNEAYLTGVGHRTAALEDARMLPLVAQPLP